VDTITKIKSEKDNPKRLWRTLIAPMGSTDPVQELTHTADQFLDFFLKKVKEIGAYTVYLVPLAGLHSQTNGLMGAKVH